MSRETLQVNRRQLLAGVGGLGAMSLGGGAVTGAYFSANRSVTAAQRAGLVGIDLSCADVDTNGSTDSSCTVSNGRVEFNFDSIDRGDSGHVDVRVAVTDNPVRLWVRTDCPPASDSLGEELFVAIRDNTGKILASGSLTEVRTALSGGTGLSGSTQIGDNCVDGGSHAELTVSWELPAEVPDSVAGEITDLTLEFYAEQCRHGDASAGNPFVGSEPCDGPGEECPNCVPLGKADDLDELMPIEPSTSDPSTWLALDEGPGSGTYFLFVEAVDDKDGGSETTGIRFRLVDADGNAGPKLCRVYLKGGPGRAVRIVKESGSWTVVGGDGQGVRTVDIVPPSVETGEILYAPERTGDDYYALSHIVVSVCTDEETL